MDGIDQSLLDDLITESNEHLENVEPSLLLMEEEGAVSPELINEIFRAMHSIKGGFGFFGLSNIQGLSHKMESVLMLVRDGELTITSAMTDALLAGVDKLREMLDNVQQSEDISIAAELEPLLLILGEGPEVGEAGAEKGQDGNVDNILSGLDLADASLTEMKAMVEPGMQVFVVEIQGHLDLRDKNLDDGQFVEIIENIGVVLSTGSSFADCLKNGSTGTLLFASIIELDHLPGFLNISAAQIYEIDLKDLQAALEEKGSLAPPPPSSPIVSPVSSESPKAKPLTPPTPQKKCPPVQPKHEAAETLRVRVELLNRLMDLAGELVLGRNQIKQALQTKLSVALANNKTLTQFEICLENSFDAILDIVGRDFGPINETSRLRKGVEEECTLLKKSFRSALGFGLIETPGLFGIMQNIDMVISDIQNDIMNTRMQPVGGVFSKFTRVIRDMSKKLAKSFELTTEGQEVELDKSIIELLGDPLTHLIRNCADHGIESPQVREAAGKNSSGSIILRAYHEGGAVNIDVIDDGAGLDVETIKRKAVEKGQITKEALQSLSENEVLALIFAPGLSTAEEVTDVSGRGVGMDVVKTNIEKLGGVINIESTLGQGTRINLRLPLTLAIIPSLLVSSEGRLLAVPEVSIKELVRIPAMDVSDRIENIQGMPILRLREKLLPLIRLNDVFGLPATWVDDLGERHQDRRGALLDRRKLAEEFCAEDLLPNHTDMIPSQTTVSDRIDKIVGDDARHDNVRRSDRHNALHIIVLKHEKNYYGLIVDHMLDNEEIVVKPLPTYFKNCDYYAGVTIMGDGRVAMILDAVGIARSVGLRFDAKLAHENELLTAQSEEYKEAQQFILFHSGGGEKFVINIAMVARVEKISQDRIEKIGDKEFLKYENSSLQVIALDQYLPVGKSPKRPDSFFVIVPKLVKDPIGIIAYHLDDIINHRLDVNRQNNIGAGVLGTIMHQDEMLLVLDLYALFEAVDPEREGRLHKGQPLTGKRILLAEDTAFFRAVESDYLESIGCVVDVCNDGAEAWEKIQNGRYDMLVTDIEMPKMDGIELAKKVRENEKFKEIPIVALTSLIFEKDRDRILMSGVDAYETKLDKVHLLDTLRSLLTDR